MNNKIEPIGVCDLCHTEMPHDKWYTRRGPRLYCSRECRNTANSRAGAGIRSEKARQRVAAGAWQNPAQLNPPTGKEQARRASLGRRREVAAGSWRNPAMNAAAREKLSRPRKHSGILHRTLERLTAGARMAELSEEECHAYRQYRKQLKKDRRHGGDAMSEQETILAFVREFYGDHKWQMENGFLVFNLPHLTDEQMLNSPLGQNLALIAAAAAGKLDRGNFEAADEVQGACQELAEWLFCPPGMPAAYSIPSEFWDAPIGELVARAFIWLDRDKLITIAEAAKIAGVTVSAIAGRIARGTLRSYTDPDAHLRQAKRLVRQGDIEPRT